MRRTHFSMRHRATSGRGPGQQAARTRGAGRVGAARVDRRSARQIRPAAPAICSICPSDSPAHTICSSDSPMLLGPREHVVIGRADRNSEGRLARCRTVIDPALTLIERSAAGRSESTQPRRSDAAAEDISGAAAPERRGCVSRTVAGAKPGPATCRSSSGCRRRGSPLPARRGHRAAVHSGRPPRRRRRSRRRGREPGGRCARRSR